MSSRWEHPNFNPWEWDELGENDLIVEARKMLYNDSPLDKEILHLLIFDCVMGHLRINALKERSFKARVRRMFRIGRKG